jgi:MYXO-CTERM domain-containing protein
MRARTVIVLAAAAMTVPILAPPARAYVRALSASGSPLYWSNSCATVTIYPNGFSMMTSEEVAKSIAAAAHAWSPDEVTCPGPGGSDGGSGHPYFEVIPSLSTGGPVPGIGYDGKNSIIFQTTSWPEDPSLIAFTQHFSRPDGEIVDSDMEINAVPGTFWANLDLGSPALGHGQEAIDLQTAITHEFGHFIGLAHTCVHTGFDPPASPLDDQGQPVPECPQDPQCPPGSDVPQSQSVMWFNVCAASTTKRVITADDARGICDIYPAANDPQVCAPNLPDDGCGCAAAGGPGARSAAIGLLALALAVAHARRRRLRSDRDRRATL